MTRPFQPCLEVMQSMARYRHGVSFEQSVDWKNLSETLDTDSVRPAPRARRAPCASLLSMFSTPMRQIS